MQTEIWNYSDTTKNVKCSNLQLCHGSHFVQVNLIATPTKNNANISTNEPQVVIESWDKACNLYIESIFMSALRLILFIFPRSFKINGMTQSYWLEICSLSTCPLRIKKILKHDLIASVLWTLQHIFNCDPEYKYFIYWNTCSKIHSR